MSASEHTAHGRGRRGQEEELTSAVHDLTGRIEALQAEVRRLRGTGLPAAEHGWKDDSPDPAAAPSYAWIGSVEAPIHRKLSVPRVAFYVPFLAAVAAAAGFARLDAVVIVGVMAAAWAIVALIEWAASRAERQLDAYSFGAPPARSEPVPSDPAWFQPPVEHTLLEPPPDSPTAITRLPQFDLDATVDRRPGD